MNIVPVPRWVGTVRYLVKEEGRWRRPGPPAVLSVLLLLLVLGIAPLPHPFSLPPRLLFLRLSVLLLGESETLNQLTSAICVAEPVHFLRRLHFLVPYSF